MNIFQGAIMANLQIKGMDDDLYAKLKEAAASENRSISQQVIFLIKSHIATSKRCQNMKTPAQILLELSGSWDDDREAAEIVREIKSSRKNTGRLKEGF